MLKDYQQTVDYLYSNLPMFQRVGASAFKKDLTNTLKLCAALGNPQLKFKTIHVAGTNGKGSTSHFLASILQCAGYKTGLYTSPHLKEFTERIKVDGLEVEKEFVVSFVNKVLPVIKAVQPSFFEITVAMAFDYFASQQVDVAVIEVGLGGRLDSTNIITPILSVITNISLDHTDMLGDTLEAIATEKAGIIKPATPVVISERQEQIEHVFRSKASQCKSDIVFASEVVKVQRTNEQTISIEAENMVLNEVTLSLRGDYQLKNIPGVLCSIIELQKKGFSISQKAIKEGLGRVVTLTGLKGRWQKLNDKPLMLCDTGHNADGVKETMQQLMKLRFRKLFIVWGMVKDKDPSPIFEHLPREAYYFFCQASIPRALSADDLAHRAGIAGLQGEVIQNVNNAIEAAKQHAHENDVIFIGGSTFVVAEIDNL